MIACPKAVLPARAVAWTRAVLAAIQPRQTVVISAMSVRLALSLLIDGFAVPIQVSDMATGCCVIRVPEARARLHSGIFAILDTDNAATEVILLRDVLQRNMQSSKSRHATL